MTVDDQPTAAVQDANTVVGAPRSGIPDRFLDDVYVRQVEPSGSTLASRIVVVAFGLIQIVIGLRIILLALDARTGNDLVRAVLDLSQVFVAPFEGILRSDALTSGGGVLDVAAILALIGWTLLELVVLAVVRIWRPGNRV